MPATFEQTAVGCIAVSARGSCIFCQNTRPLSTEDVYPRWAARSLGVGRVAHDRATFDHLGQQVKSSTQIYGSLAVIKVKAPCVRCNSGWMSEIQNNASLVLRPMVADRETTRLVHDELATIASWATMTAITYDPWHRDDRYLPPSVAHTFFALRKPLPGMRVRLAVFDPGGGIYGPHGRHLFPFDGFGATLTIVTLNHLVLWVWLPHGSALLEPEFGDVDEYINVWPIRDEVVWPPAQPLRW